MPLQIFFGEDEHTATEGPYSRVLKTRKWLIVSSAIVFFVRNGHYHEQAVRDAVKVISAPEAVVRTASELALIYLLIKYILLIVQLISAYRIVLDERFAGRRQEELGQLREILDKSRKDYHGAVSRLEDIAFRRRLKKREESLAKVVSDPAALDALPQIERDRAQDEYRRLLAMNDMERRRAYNFGWDLEEVQARHLRNEYRMSVLSGEAPDLESIEENDAAIPEEERELVADVASKEVAFREARHALDKAMAGNPGGKALYRFAERLIDLLRIAPPLIVAGWALVRA